MRRWHVVVGLFLVVVLVCLPGPRAYAEAVSAVGVLGLWFGGGLGGFAYVAGAVLAVAIGIAIGAEVHPLSRFVEWVNRSTVVDDYISTLDVSQQADLAVMGQQYVSTGSMTVAASIAPTVSFFEPVVHAYPVGREYMPSVSEMVDVSEGYDLGDAVMFVYTKENIASRSLARIIGYGVTYYLAPFSYNRGTWRYTESGVDWLMPASSIVLVWWAMYNDWPYPVPVIDVDHPAVTVVYDISEVYEEIGISVDGSGGQPVKEPDKPPHSDLLYWLAWAVITITASATLLKEEPEKLQQAEKEALQEFVDIQVEQWNWARDNEGDLWNPNMDYTLHHNGNVGVIPHRSYKVVPEVEAGSDVSVSGIEVVDIGDGTYELSIPWMWDGTSQTGVEVSTEEVPEEEPEEPPGPEGTILEQILETIQTLPQAIGEAVIGPVTEIDTTVITGPMSDLTLRFPFSLPWDLVRFTELFNVESSDWAPSIALPWGTLSLALPAEFDKLRLLARWAIGVCWDVGLCWACISFFGAGDR